MLNEMLDNLKPSERLVEGDAFDQIAQRCRNVQPKIQKWIGSAEEGEDADSIGKIGQYKAWQRTLIAELVQTSSF
jgi:hypothetical protein